MIDILLGFFRPVVAKLVDRIPDPNERAKAEEEMERLLLAAAKEASSAQTQINLQEARHKSLFVAGWRPFIGWVCGIAFLYSFIAQPLLTFLFSAISQIRALPFDPERIPTLDMGPLMTVLLGMLGLGTMRTFEKIRNVASENLKQAPVVVSRS